MPSDAHCRPRALGASVLHVQFQVWREGTLQTLQTLPSATPLRDGAREATGTHSFSLCPTGVRWGLATCLFARQGPGLRLAPASLSTARHE